MLSLKSACLSAAVGLALVAPPAAAQSTEEVLGHHLEAFGAGDVDAIMTDYGDDSVLIDEAATREGPEEIRQLFVDYVEEFSKPGMSFEMIDQRVAGEVAYIVWKAETADRTFEYATDTFVIRDGKIAYHTIAAKTAPK